MRYTKVIHHSMDIEDPISLCINFEANILTRAQDIFKGKNYAGLYIYDVISVAPGHDGSLGSDLVIGNKGSAVGASIEIDIVVDVEEYLPGEAIIDFELVKMMPNKKDAVGQTRGTMTAQATVLLTSAEAQPLFDVLRPRQLLPITVISVRNEIMTSRPVISASIWKPTAVITEITSANGMSANGTALLREITTYKAILKSIDMSNKIVQSFETLFGGPHGSKGSDLFDKDGVFTPPTKPGFYKRDTSVSALARAEVYFIGATKPAASGNGVTAANGWSEILFTYLQDLKVYCGFLTNYTTEEIMKEHSALWLFYSKLIKG
jgi:hypothetical protein